VRVHVCRSSLPTIGRSANPMVPMRLTQRLDGPSRYRTLPSMCSLATATLAPSVLTCGQRWCANPQCDVNANTRSSSTFWQKRRAPRSPRNRIAVFGGGTDRVSHHSNPTERATGASGPFSSGITSARLRKGQAHASGRFAGQSASSYACCGQGPVGG
jgi:hypothetical protein